MLTTAEAAEMLDVPFLAIGQIVMDGRLKIYEGFTFKKSDVERVALDTLYIASLR